MQNKYVGDVGDFGKYGLLRFLSGETAIDDLDRLRLGMVWYLHHDERHGADKTKSNGDGKHTGYLTITAQNIKEYGKCDHDLWCKLGHLVGQDARCVHCVAQAGILPSDTLYYDAQLYYVPKMLKSMKEDTRKHWFEKALAATCAADLVYMDPDTGITGDTRMYHEDGPKFVYVSDLQALWERGQSLVVYHHLGHGNPEELARQKAKTLKAGLTGAEPIPLLFRKGSVRAFYVIPQPCRKEIIETRISRMLNTPWKCHFSRVLGV